MITRSSKGVVLNGLTAARGKAEGRRLFQKCPDAN